MTRGEKLAVGQILFSLLTLVVVASLVPIGGDGARIGFVVLFLMFPLMWVLRGRKGETVSDERDSQIGSQASSFAGISTLIIMTVGCLVLGFYYDNILRATIGVPTEINASAQMPAQMAYWIATIWVPVFHLIAGAVALKLYRKSEHAA